MLSSSTRLSTYNLNIKTWKEEIFTAPYPHLSQLKTFFHFWIKKKLKKNVLSVEAREIDFRSWLTGSFNKKSVNFQRSEEMHLHSAKNHKIAEPTGS